MPNHITNVIQMQGDPERIREVRKALMNAEIGPGSLDFQKIIPMPESLNIEASTRTERGLRAYEGFLQVYTLAGTLGNDTMNVPAVAEEKYLQARPDISPKEFAMGKQAYLNKQLYGATNWYDWCCSNWGTKWNGYSEEEAAYAGDDSFRFHSAWSAPHPVMDRLAEMYPDLTFIHRWADEDIGWNCGSRTYENGECTEVYSPSGPEAIRFSADVMDEEPEDWGLFLNKDGTDYINGYDYRFENGALHGKPVMIAERALPAHEIPQDLYAYYCWPQYGALYLCDNPNVHTADITGTILSLEPLMPKGCGVVSTLEENLVRAGAENRTTVADFILRGGSPMDQSEGVMFQ